MKTVLRSSGTFNQGMSAKKLAQEGRGRVLVAHALKGSASEAPVGQGESMERGVKNNSYRLMLAVCSWGGPWSWQLALAQGR